jgi:3-hydroxybutyryl-CoA dehydrogenase
MTIAILADDVQRKEILEKETSKNVEIIWADSLRSLLIIDADVYFDLLFTPDRERIDRLRKLFPKPVVIDAVPYTTAQLDKHFIRINAWPTLIKRAVTEFATADEKVFTEAKQLFDKLGWKVQSVPDITGMVVPRVIASVINEAYFTFGAGISTKEAIDIAMKLGTNYPLGPFEWSQAIGLHRVYELLKELSRRDNRYQPAPLLLKEVKE